jgi:hypothetical protein
VGRQWLDALFCGHQLDSGWNVQYIPKEVLPFSVQCRVTQSSEMFNENEVDALVQNGMLAGTL